MAENVPSSTKCQTFWRAAASVTEFHRLGYKKKVTEIKTQFIARVLELSSFLSTFSLLHSLNLVLFMLAPLIQICFLGSGPEGVEAL